ncbi:MAG: cysteine desulfurase family protein [Candidatus Coproplasma sp.]
MIYLDYSATTPLDSDVLEAMTPYLTTIFGNSSSQHSFGRKAGNAVQDARDKMAKILGVKGDELYFTSGGTESGNTALKGICRQNIAKGKHIVLSAFEHPALLESAKDLEREGFEVTLVNPDKRGIVSPQSVSSAIRPDTVFVGVMGANNEVGTVQPIEEIYDVCKQRGVFFFCDCVQVAGVIPFNKFPADGISFSAHKFYGPKGFGVLYMRGDRPFRRLISGGGQERSLRGGTTYVAGAVGCAYALEKAYLSMEEHNAKVKALRDEFIDRVLTEIPDTHLNGDRESRLPANANISFDGCDGEQIVFALDLKGIATSTGSACSSGAVTLSHVLLSMGLSEERVKSAVRFTFGKYNIIEEVEEAVQALKQIVARIRAK